MIEDAHPNQVATAFAMLLTQTNLKELRLQPLINAGKAGLLGYAFRQWIEERGWLRIEHRRQGYLNVRTLGDLVSEKAVNTDPGFYKIVAQVLALPSFRESADEPGLIQFFDAATFGFDDWACADVYGERGKERLSHYGLEFCHPSDCLKIFHYIHGSGSRVHILHNPIEGNRFSIERRATSPSRLCVSAGGELNRIFKLSWVAVRTKNEE